MVADTVAIGFGREWRIVGPRSAVRRPLEKIPIAECDPHGDGRRFGTESHRMDSRPDTWVDEQRRSWRGQVEPEWESFDPETEEGGWIFDEDEDGLATDCGDELTSGPGETSVANPGLSKSLATAFLIADIGIRLTCIDHHLDGDPRGRPVAESLGRFYETLCHAVEEGDAWRVETAMGCLRERLHPVADFSNECARMTAELESLFGRLHVRCVPVAADGAS